MRSFLLIFLLSISLALADNPRGDDDDEGGKLDDIEKDLGGDDSTEFLLDAIVFLIIHSPDLLFAIPDILFGESTDYGFSKHPYFYENDGLYSQYEEKSLVYNFKASYLYESNSLQAIDFQSIFYPSRFFSVEFIGKKYGERISFGNDDLLVGDIYLNYQRIREEFFALRWGLGAKYLSGNSTFWGPGYNLALDIFPFDPISLNVQYTGAFIDNSYQNELGIDLNFHSRHLLFFIGYDYFGTRSVSINSFKIGAGFHL